MEDRRSAECPVSWCTRAHASTDYTAGIVHHGAIVAEFPGRIYLITVELAWAERADSAVLPHVVAKRRHLDGGTQVDLTPRQALALADILTALGNAVPFADELRNAASVLQPYWEAEQ